MVQVAANKYRQTKPADLNNILAPPEEENLPMAAGAEHANFNTGPSAPDKPKRILVNPLDAEPEAYL